MSFDKKSDNIVFRATAELKRDIAWAAGKKKVKPSEWIRNVIEKALTKGNGKGN